MKRQGGHYGGDSGHHAYGGGGAAQSHNQWRLERDARQHDKLPQSAMSPTPPYSQGQGRDSLRSSYHSQRVDLSATFGNQGEGDRRSQPHEEDMDRRYEDNSQVTMQTFEGLERKFLDDILILSKEQADAEDAENARHRERINAISAQYEAQLAALRARHTNRREEFLQRESQARQQQYQQLVMDQYPTTRVITSSDPRGVYSVEEAPPSGDEQSRAYNADYYDSYRGRGRYHGHERDHGFESKVSYPRGRSYDTGRYH